MRQLQSVLWTKGLLLTPQHLQAQDRFLEDLIGFRLSSVAFNPWGFSRLEIDREALAGGMLALTRAAGLFPDGLLFDLPASDPAPAPKPLEEHWLADEDTLDVHLAIPELRMGGHNISRAHDSRGTRYIAEVLLRRDENTGKAEKPIQIARKNFLLVTQTESLDGSTSMQVARIRRAPAGDYQLDPGFVPPLIDIAGSDYVMSLVRRLVEMLGSRSATLAGTRRQRAQGLADFGVADVANFWLLYTVNMHFPVFRHLFETRGGHPADLYAAMLALAGALTTFSTDIHPRDLPSYDHADLSTCFTRLDEQLRQLLETVVPVNHVSLPLVATEPSVYATAIDQDRYFGAPEWYLAVQAETDPAELVRKAPQGLKVSSASEIDRLIKHALAGIELRHVPQPPRALPVKLDYQYFRLERSGEGWDAVRRARNLAVFVPADFPAPRLELVILLPSERR